MCGINGVYGLEKVNNPQAIIHRMNDAVAHRGPDAEGVFSGENVVLGHRRLSIIDTSQEGNQPFYSSDGNLVMVFNGEIYNYLELREELSDFHFKTSSDTEVLLAAYTKWGINFLGRLNGMFALAIWNKLSRELMLARDRMGIKPLYIARHDSGIVFSSEIRAILGTGLIERSINTDGLIDYLRYQTVHAPQTIVQGVEMMLPGHYISVTDNEISSHKYWAGYTHYSGLSTGMDIQTIQQTIHEKLLNSVRMRMRADVPFGAFLSGGIDSSAIVGLMSQVSSHPVNTFSVTFEEDQYSEAPYSNMIAQKFGTMHTEIKLSVNDFLKLLPASLQAMDHPSGDGPNTYVVSKVTKESGITMALSGLGGDELFAGYDIFKRVLSLQDKRWIMSFPKGLRNLATSALKTIKPGPSSDKIAVILGQDYMDFEYVYPVNRQVLIDSEVKNITDKSTLPMNSNRSWLAEALAYETLGFNLPWLSKVSIAEIYTYMQNVLLRDSDQMSMAHALEVRVPFLDHELAEFVLGVQDEHKYPHSPKQLLVDSLGDLLPREIVDRPKMGFTFPWEVWMKNDLREFSMDRLTALGKRDHFNQKAVEEMWKRFLAGRLSWSRIWPLIVLENWLSDNATA